MLLPQLGSALVSRQSYIFMQANVDKNLYLQRFYTIFNMRLCAEIYFYQVKNVLFSSWVK